MANRLALIIEREYLERVRRKSFLISTLLVPIVMIAIMLAPAFFMAMGGSEQKTVTVVDGTGEIARRLQGNDEITFVSSDAPVDSLRADEANEAILVISADALDDPSHGIVLLTRGSISMMTDSYITSQLEQAIEAVRLDL